MPEGFPSKDRQENCCTKRCIGAGVVQLQNKRHTV